MHRDQTEECEFVDFVNLSTMDESNGYRGMKGKVNCIT